MSSRYRVCFLLIAFVAGLSLPSTTQAQTKWTESEAAIYSRLQFLGDAVMRRQAERVSKGQHSVANQTANQLSWRVHLLPYLGEPELYEEFHLNEPWDSPHNKSLVGRMPKVYSTGESDSKTRLQMFSGQNTIFKSAQPNLDLAVTRSSDLRIMIVATDVKKAVPWTGPDSLETDGSDLFNLLGKPSSIHCITNDLNVVSLPKSITPAKLKALVIPVNGEKVDVAEYRVDKNQVVAPEIAIQRAEKKKRVQQLITMKKIWTAIREYDQKHRSLPVRRWNDKHFDQDQNPKLSWRVHILPFLKEDELYNQFKLDEPWDSSHNAELLAKMPEVFREPADPPEATATRIKLLKGPKTALPTKELPKFSEIPFDTILLIRTGQETAVPWTKPEDADFDPNHPKSILGQLDDNILCITCTGDIHAYSLEIPDELFRAIVIPIGTQDGRKVLTDEIKPWDTF